MNNKKDDKPTGADVKRCRYWAIVPAAGIGSRMQSDRPKQYLSLNGKTVLEQTLTRLLALPLFEKIIVAVSPIDQTWSTLPMANHGRIGQVVGGAERCDSVLNGLRHLSEIADADDWVLVHDVARPCVTVAQIKNLIDTVSDHSVGGILAIPVSDTLKKVQGVDISSTVDRSDIWQAQTPQMFRLKPLLDALSTGLEQGVAMTDEASAMEWAGHKPIVVESSRDNIKITRPEDLALAAYFLEQQSVLIREE